MPSYAPVTNWFSNEDDGDDAEGDAEEVVGVAIDEGVDGCEKEAKEGVVVLGPARRSYAVTVRSVDADKIMWPEDVSARSRNGLAEAVYTIKLLLSRGLWKNSMLLTIVDVQTLCSTSHVRIVESRPQLYAVFPALSRPKIARETRAVWLFSTASGAFLTGLSPFSSTLRRFFLFASPEGCESGTSSDAGIDVSQRPMRPSQDAVRTCLPLEFAATEETGDV